MARSSSLLLSLLLTGLVWTAWIVPVVAQPSVQLADQSQALDQRWEWALDQQANSSNALIAWRFTGELDEKLHVNGLPRFGHGFGWNGARWNGVGWNGVGWSNGVSIDALLAGNHNPQQSYLRERDLIVLGQLSDGKLVDVDVFEHDQPVAWQLPLYWLGEANASQSYQLLATLLDSEGSQAANRGLINALALHSVNERTAFLNSLMNTEQWKEYRSALLYALAQQRSSTTETLLLAIAEDSEAVIRERIQATSLLRGFNSAETLALLLALSSGDEPEDLRREAIESLAWFLADDVSLELNQLAWFDENHRIRNEAV